MLVKIGTFDDKSFFKPQIAIFTCDKQPYHHIAEGIPAFEKRVVTKQAWTGHQQNNEFEITVRDVCVGNSNHDSFTNAQKVLIEVKW